jgi:hypothetical protein
MTLQTGTDRMNWRRAVIGGLASGVLAAGLMTGFGASTAFAQPAEPSEPDTQTADTRNAGDNCTGDDCAKPVAGEAPVECPEGMECNEDGEATPQRANADQLLSQIYAEYSQGDGGGQISKLIDDAMKLRAQGYRPSGANATALQQALEFRPNQTPLVEALKETISYQRKLQAQAAMNTQQQGPIAGPVPVIPPGTMTIPLG